MFLEIKKLFEVQNKLICKRFEMLEKKIDTKMNGFRDRLTKLERKKRKPKGTPKMNVKKANKYNSNCSGIEELEKEILKTTPEHLGRKIPSPFKNFVKNQLKNEEDINIHIVGTRIYHHIKNGCWIPVSSPNKYMNECLQNLWRRYHDAIIDLYEDHHGWPKVYKQIYERHEELHTFNVTTFKTMLLAKTDIAASNRGI